MGINLEFTDLSRKQVDYLNEANYFCNVFSKDNVGLTGWLIDYSLKHLAQLVKCSYTSLEEEEAYINSKYSEYYDKEIHEGLLSCIQLSSDLSAQLAELKELMAAADKKAEEELD